MGAAQSAQQPEPTASSSSLPNVEVAALPSLTDLKVESVTSEKTGTVTTAVREVYIVMMDGELAGISDEDREWVRRAPLEAGPVVIRRYAARWFPERDAIVRVSRDHLETVLPASGPRSAALARQLAQTIVDEALAIDGHTYYFSGGGNDRADLVFDDQWRCEPPEDQLLFNRQGSLPSEKLPSGPLDGTITVVRARMLWV